MTKQTSKSSRISLDQSMIEGIKKHLSGVSLVVAGQTVTDVESETMLQARIDAGNASITAKAAFRAAVQKERAEIAATKVAASNLRKAILMRFGDQADVLGDFGLAPPKKRTAPTAATRSKAAQKALATRAARHTMGKKQKAQIHGTVLEEPTVTPPPPPTKV